MSEGRTRKAEQPMGMTWYENQRTRDDKSRKESESLLGPEREVFAEFMGLTASCLDAVFDSDQVNRLDVRRLIEFGNHAFNLIWSAWDEMLCGRYDASQGHLRSISDSREFIMAIFAQPEIADRLGSDTKDVHLARRVARDALNSDGARRGTELFGVLRDSAKRLQPLAHVSHQVAGTLAIHADRSGNVVLVRLGGHVSPVTLRLVAIPLAVDAAHLFALLSGALLDLTSTSQDAWKLAVAAAQARTSLLADEINKIRAEAGPPASALRFIATNAVSD